MTDLVKRLRGRTHNGELLMHIVDRYIEERAEAAAEIERLTAQLDEATEALENVMGSVDTPISRRRLNINDDQPEWLTSSRATLARIKEPRNGLR